MELTKTELYDLQLLEIPDNIKRQLIASIGIGALILLAMIKRSGEFPINSIAGPPP